MRMAVDLPGFCLQLCRSYLVLVRGVETVGNLSVSYLTFIALGDDPTARSQQSIIPHCRCDRTAGKDATFTASVYDTTLPRGSRGHCRHCLTVMSGLSAHCYSRCVPTIAICH